MTGEGVGVAMRQRKGQCPPGEAFLRWTVAMMAKKTPGIDAMDSCISGLERGWRDSQAPTYWTGEQAQRGEGTCSTSQ